MGFITLDEIIARQLMEPTFRVALLGEVISQMMTGDYDSALSSLRRMVMFHNTQPDFSKVPLDVPNPSLSAQDLFRLVGALQVAEQCTLEVRIASEDHVEIIEHPEPLDSLAA